MARTNSSRTLLASLGSSFHLASVLLQLVEHVSELSNSFRRLSSFSSELIATSRSSPSPTLVTSSKSDENQGPRVPDNGERAGPPGWRMAPTAVDLEMLLGRTRKLFFPGIIRSPKRSPRLESYVSGRCSHTSRESLPVKNVVLGFSSLSPRPRSSRTVLRLSSPVAPYDRSFTFLDK